MTDKTEAQRLADLTVERVFHMALYWQAEGASDQAQRIAAQRRVIDFYVNKTHIANEVMQAVREARAEAAQRAREASK